MTTVNNRSDSGFTFLEVVVSIAILSVMMLLTYSSLKQISSSDKILREEREIRSSTNTLISRLTREVQLATDLPNQRLLGTCGADESQQPSKGILLIGGPAEDGLSEPGTQVLQFIATGGSQYIAGRAMQSNTVQISYRLIRDTEGTMSDGTSLNPEDPPLFLIREEIPLIRNRDEACKARVVFPLADNVVAINYRFYRENDDSWSNSWGSNDRIGLPDLVSIQLALRGNSGRIDYVSVLLKLARTEG